ncbi:protein ALTERED PHOSPHATE STARVATION RESPONSE 1-like [Silene latifolia]|uniref:protein ALTERED PHOSPHATE STARVATION RESPONSE 1-like n=1 Tax=Silene latifolia TaxID=37657 RepID=UPI003D76D9FD
MGSCVSKITQETLSRCKARTKYMKQFLESRHNLSVSLSSYLRSLRSVSASLLRFAAAESSLHQNHHHHPPPPPSPPPMSPSTDTWTTNATVLPPPPPPPMPSGGSTWDFWDPFTAEYRIEDEWYDSVDDSNVSPVVVKENAAAETEAETETVLREEKEMVEIIKELDEYFFRAANAGGFVSGVLEIPAFSYGKESNNGRSLRWTPVLWGGNGKRNGLGFRKLGEDCGMVVGKMEMINVNQGIINNVINHNGTGSHSATVDRLYAWEKKLFSEVKNAEKLKMEHEKRVEQLRRLEIKKADNMKTKKIKKEVEKLEKLLEVASQAIQTTSDEITKLRETQLYPQLLDIIKGFMCMWRSMYECHQVQTDIVAQLKYLNAIPSTEPTSEIHRQSTLQLESEIQQWQQSLSDLVKSQCDYIYSLTGWLRLSLFQINQNSLMKTIQDSAIYSLCEEWQMAIDHFPDKVASEGINSFLGVVHAIVVQQSEEHKQKKKSENADKELEKIAAELRAAEGKYGPSSLLGMSGTRKGWDPVGEKRVKVDMLKAKAAEEKSRHEKAVGMSRAMTLNNLQTGLPHVFQALTGFSSVCAQGFENVYNKDKNMDQEHHSVTKQSG